VKICESQHRSKIALIDAKQGPIHLVSKAFAGIEKAGSGKREFVLIEDQCILVCLKP
jgi:hypothetical protein